MSSATVTPATFAARQAAEFLGLGRTVFLRDVAPTIPHVRLSAGRVGYRVDDLKKLLDEHTVVPEES
jgi:hypothetical protein